MPIVAQECEITSCEEVRPVYALHLPHRPCCHRSKKYIASQFIQLINID